MSKERTIKCEPMARIPYSRPPSSAVAHWDHPRATALSSGSIAPAIVLRIIQSLLSRHDHPGIRRQWLRSHVAQDVNDKLLHACILTCGADVVAVQSPHELNGTRREDL